MIAVINAAQALQRLGAIHEALPADDQEKQRIRDALDELRHVSALPFGVANHLSAEAQTLKDQPAVDALKDAANAIRSCHAILEHS